MVTTKFSQKFFLTSNYKSVRNYKSFLQDCSLNFPFSFFVPEEDAVKIFKTIGIFIAALKDPSSYDSLDAFHRAVSKCKHLEAISLMVKNTVRCLLQGAPADEKTKLIKVRLLLLFITLSRKNDFFPRTFDLGTS